MKVEKTQNPFYIFGYLLKLIKKNLASWNFFSKFYSIEYESNWIWIEINSIWIELDLNPIQVACNVIQYFQLKLISNFSYCFIVIGSAYQHKPKFNKS
jgi:hypothetical protein